MLLSLLDRSRTRDGEASATALTATVRRARRAESLGFHRFWGAEHHAVPGIASGSPPVLIAAIAAQTSQIRVGSGGVMLPNHAPIVVAEQFLMLEALYPGRIDLGLGRSLGFTRPVREALGVTTYSPQQFAADIKALQNFLTGSAPVTVMPRVTTPPPMFVLANREGLAVAAQAGLPVVVGGPALHDEDSGLDTYRQQFRPTPTCPQPQVIISLDVMVADTTQRARDLLLPEAWAMAESRSTGVFPPLSPVSLLHARQPTAQQQRRIEATIAGTIHGTPAQVRDHVRRLIDRTGAEELLVSTSTHDHDDLAEVDARLAELFVAS